MKKTMLYLIVLTSLIAYTSLALAGELLWPIDCVSGETCSGIGYPDIDGDGKAFNCGLPGYTGHEGTDIGITWNQMDQGIPVFAAADGEVLWVFDGKYDRCPSEHPDCQPPNDVANYASVWLYEPSTTWQARHGQTADEFGQTWDELSSQGYRLSDVDVHVINNNEYFASTWIYDNEAWQAWFLPSDDYQSKFDELSSQGYRLINIDTYVMDDVANYASVWFYDPNTTWQARHGQTPDEFDQTWDELTSQGYRLSDVDVHVINNNEYRASTWIYDNEAWQAWFLPSDSYQSKFDELVSQGYRLIDIEAYTINDIIYYASIWLYNPNTTYWQARHGQTSDDYQQTFEQLSSEGYRLIDLSTNSAAGIGPGVSSGYTVCTELGNYCGTGTGDCFWCFDGGNVVVIRHNDVDGIFATRYDHLRKNSILVSPGDFVMQGQKIAEVGSAGHSTGPHLHFEVWGTGFYELAEPWAGPCGPNFDEPLWKYDPPWGHLFANDLIIDFGTQYGIWTYTNNSTWTKLHALSSEQLISGDMDGNGIDEIIIDFGAGYGILLWMNNSAWVQLHNLSPESLVKGDIDGSTQDDIIIDFGASYGIWVRLNNSNWVQLHNLSPESLVTGDIDGSSQDDIIIDFGAQYGIWVWLNNSNWVKLHSISPSSLVTGNIDGGGQDDVIIDFGASYGIWVWMNNNTWVQLHNISPENFVTGDIDGSGQDDVIIDFGASYGIWVWLNNSNWVQLHNISPESMATGDIDSNDKDDVIIDFGAQYGIWLRMNNSDWVKLHTLSSESMVTGNIDGLSDGDALMSVEPPAGADNSMTELPALVPQKLP